MRNVSKLLALLLLANVFLGAPARAQNAGGDKEKSPLEAREAVGTVLLSGLVGGILGLSTLSFYSQPQDHIRNITLGAGAGMLISVIYLTVQAAGTPIPVDEDKEEEESTAMIFPTIEANGSLALVGSFRF